MNHQPDASIDQVLNALRDAETPTGLQQRITARLAQAAEARARNASPLIATNSPFASTEGSAPTSFLAGILTLSWLKGKNLRIFSAPVTRFTLAASSLAILAALSLFALHAHHQASAPSQINSSFIPLQTTARNPGTTASLEQPRRSSPAKIPVLAAEAITSQASNPPTTPPPTDPDAIALAETLAPSRPAPPMPLTQQEILLISATRPGQPIELAELDTARDSALRSLAAAHERAHLRQYIQGLLSPLAAAESLNPTPPDEDPPAAASDSPPSK
jgi:hypothetical protein